MSLNILVISHYFPPIPGVGGRRWTKFVKYLSKNNEISIHVVSAKNKIKGVKSSFEDELKNINFKHTTLDSNYPKYLERIELKKSTLVSKIMFRVQHYLIKKKVKGNYWDLSVFWDSHFKSTIPNIIKQDKINKLIISGPPYRYIEYACQLKIEFPDMEIILDYRDPWNDFNNPKTFKKERHDFEIELEKSMLKKVDKIITVSNFQKSLILKKQPQSAPIYVIPNGFDSEDYENTNKYSENSNKITLTHFGTLHQQKDYYWIPFFSAFKKLKAVNPNIYKSIEINLIGYTPPIISKFIKDNKLNVNIHDMIPPIEAFNELSKADVALWFKYDGSPGDFATKFGDYIALKKYMWTFSVKGAVTDHIKENNVGRVFFRNDKTLEDSIYKALLNLEDGSTRKFPDNYDSSKLDISNLTKELIKVLN